LPSELDDMLGKIKEVLKAIDIPFDIIETGEHTILVIALKKDIKQILGSKFFVKKNSSEAILPKILISTSMVKIDGGKMDFWELDGASYTPKLSRIVLPQLNIADTDAVDGFADLSQSTFVDNSKEININNVMSFLTKSGQFITDNVLLH